MKQVRDSKAASSISAKIVLNKKGQHVATVQAHHSDSTVQVDVWAAGNGHVACYKLRNPGATPEDIYQSAWADFGLQQGRAGGYGYDKYTAALAGLVIDGHTMADHCGQVPEAEKSRASLMRQYCKFHDFSGERERAAEKGWTQKHWDTRAKKIGARFANWSTEKGRYTSLHFIDGLNRLEAMGYAVIGAI